MGILSRWATLLAADAHGVVDALEDRALVLRQHVREAGAELGRKKSRLEAFEAEARDLAAESEAVAAEKKKLDEDATLALQEGDDDLARFAVRKLLPLERRLVVIARRLEDLDRERGELAEEVARQQSELERLEAQAKAYLDRLESGETPRDGAPAAAWWEPVEDEEVELELLRRRRQAAKEGRDA